MSRPLKQPMKLLVMLPHGNTASFLEQRRKALAEKNINKIFTFSPLYCPLAVAPDKEYTAAEAKTILTGLRDAVTKESKRSDCFIDNTYCMEYGSITAFFCAVTIPFLEDIRTFCAKAGFEPIESLSSGFCVGFSSPCAAYCETSFELHRMTVFQFALIDFAPEAPFLREPPFKADGNNEKSGSAEAVEPLSFKWKLINSVWKAKQKEA